MDWFESSVVVAIITSAALILQKILDRKWAKRDKNDESKKEIIEKIQGVQDDVNEFRKIFANEIEAINHRINDIQELNDRDKMVSVRNVIIDSADTIAHGCEITHTQEWWNKVLANCDIYLRYCESHPDFPNSQAVSSISVLKKKYEETLLGGFMEKEENK